MLNKHKGQDAYIIGKGMSLLNLTKDMIGEGIVITINQAIEVIDTLDLPNTIYAMAKDGPGPAFSGNTECDIPCDQCPTFTAPKNGTILVHKHESLNCFKDKKRIVFDNLDLGLSKWDFSAMSAIRIAQHMGCEKIYLVSFDLWTTGDPRSIKGVKSSYTNQLKMMKPLLKKNEWITPKLQLKDVTLVCADDCQPDEALKAIETCLRYADFYDVKFFTSNKDYPFAVPTVIHSKDAYCRFLVKELPKHLESSHCLVVQYDGYILNPYAWTKEFLKYDYIGAPWRFDTNNVGNGGFSLRSKKFLKAASKLKLEKYIPEDFILCHLHRDKMEAMGVRFAPDEVARKFAIEHSGKYGKVWDGEFGFHDFKTDISKHEY